MSGPFLYVMIPQKNNLIKIRPTMYLLFIQSLHEELILITGRLTQNIYRHTDGMTNEQGGSNIHVPHAHCLGV